VPGGANLDPHLFVELYEACVARDDIRISTLTQRLSALGQIYRVRRDASATITGIKCVLSCMGICNDLPATPFQRLDAPERQRAERLAQELALACSTHVRPASGSVSTQTPDCRIGPKQGGRG
jgi:4-hydroxy-tetrahydrodipicolinate synthase